MAPERIEPGPGQESVWDYPRPPRLERCPDRLRIEVAGRTVADTLRGWRVLETSQPPAYYVPAADVDGSLLVPSRRTSFCEWKGLATYLDVVVGDDRRPDAAWRYVRPTEAFAPIAGALAFYPQLVDACWVGDERAEPNPGGFYGGWITSRIVGPFKGGPGTAHW